MLDKIDSMEENLNGSQQKLKESSSEIERTNLEQPDSVKLVSIARERRARRDQKELALTGKKRKDRIHLSQKRIANTIMKRY